MARKDLFAPASRLPSTDCVNEAGGDAYAFSAEHALAQYAVTGTFNRTFYAHEAEQLEKTLALCSAVAPEFIAKTALYARERGFMKDMPAFLTAVLAAKDVRLLAAVFPRVVDSGKMLRNFVQIIRSGVAGRKSFGSAPKRLCQEWFAKRSPDNVFRQSLGNDPSMADVIKMVRPKPAKLENGAYGEKDVTREALYGYLIGKQLPEAVAENLPPLVRAFESFKAGKGDVPEVPFEMLTALDLDTEKWSKIAESMTWTQTRMNLATLARHGVFSNPTRKRGEAMTSIVAARLRNPELIRRARAFPYQLLAAFKAASQVGATVPAEITMALQQAMEIAIENVPVLESAQGKSMKVYLCPDVSGSMQSPVTGGRKGSTTAVRCLDVAALVAAAFLRRNPSATIIPFSDDVVPPPRPINPLDSVMTNAHLLASLPSGGTACSAPLRQLNERKSKGDLVIYVSDNMSWADFATPAKQQRAYRKNATIMAEEWETFCDRNRGAKLVLIDLQPNASTQVVGVRKHSDEGANVLNVGGFSDSVFQLVSLFSRGELGGDHWVREIEKMVL
ncbi:MAG: RNA-binding protein [Polyangiales bacterium]